MAYPIRAIAGMPRSLKAALARRGISDTETLLVATRLPRQRRALAVSLGVDAAELDVWAAVADLVRISTLSPATAELIVRSGVARNVQELALALPIATADSDAPIDLGHTPDPVSLEVEERLRRHAAEHGLEARVPWSQDLQQASAEARELRPRLVARATAIESGIESKLVEIRSRTLRNARRTLLGLTAFLVAFSAVGLAVLTWSLRREANRGFDAWLGDGVPEAALPVIHTLRSVVMAYLSANAWALAALLAGVMGTFVALFMAHTLLAEGWRWLGARVMLRTYEARAAYVDVLAYEASRIRYLGKVLWATIIGATVIALAIVLILRAAAPETLEQALIIGLAAIVPVAVLAAFWPSTRYLLTRWRTHGALSAPIVRSVVAFNVIAVVMQVGFVAATIYAFPIALRAAASASNAVYHHRTAQITTTYEAELARHADRWQPPGYADDATAFLNDIRERFAGLADTATEVPGRAATALVSMGAYLTPSLALAALFSIVLPFLILGGWLRGAFFIVLLAAISWTELGAQRYITANLTRWFTLDEGARIIPVLVGIALFGNAIVFEWIYELTLERKDTCEECGAEVERKNTYCPGCGIVQR